MSCTRCVPNKTGHTHCHLCCTDMPHDKIIMHLGSEHADQLIMTPDRDGPYVWPDGTLVIPAIDSAAAEPAQS